MLILNQSIENKFCIDNDQNISKVIILINHFPCMVVWLSEVNHKEEYNKDE